MTAMNELSGRALRARLEGLRMIQSRLYDDVEHHDAVLREIAGAGALNMSHVVLFLAGMAADAMRAAGFDEDELRANVDREIVELRAEIARR